MEYKLSEKEQKVIREYTAVIKPMLEEIASKKKEAICMFAIMNDLPKGSWDFNEETMTITIALPEEPAK